MKVWGFFAREAVKNLLFLDIIFTFRAESRNYLTKRTFTHKIGENELHSIAEKNDLDNKRDG